MPKQKIRLRSDTSPIYRVNDDGTLTIVRGLEKASADNPIEVIFIYETICEFTDYGTGHTATHLSAGEIISVTVGGVKAFLENGR